MPSESEYVMPTDARLDGVILDKWWSTASPQAQRLFTIYFNEAIFAEKLLASDLNSLRPNSVVVEVGSGVGFLSFMIAARGHTVIGYEPESSGFGTMRELNEVVQRSWVGNSRSVPHFNWEKLPLDSVGINQIADLVLAFHVIEHVPKPSEFVVSITKLLKSEGTARFICPNYSFPYEPHFGVPAVLTKGVTRRLFGRSLRSNMYVHDAQQFWEDLSWPRQNRLRKDLRKAKIHTLFSRRSSFDYLSRLTNLDFLERKGAFFKLASKFVPVLTFGFSLLPTRMLPIIDLTTRPSDFS